MGAMHTDQTWLIVLSDLSSKGRVAKKDYQSWLERTKLLGLDREAGTATVGAPDSWTVETLNKRYRETVAESLSAVLRQPVTVEFVVLNSTGAAASTAPAPANSYAGRRESVNARPARNATSNPPRSPLPGSPPPALQLEPGAGSDGLNPRYVFDTFIVGPSNRLAHAASLAVADNPGGDYNPLFIYGGVGLGKTHLMHAIGHRAREQFGTDLRVLYVTSEKFTNEMIASIRSGKMEEFRDRYRTIDILMIDDIQFIARQGVDAGGVLPHLQSSLSSGQADHPHQRPPAEGDSDARRPPALALRVGPDGRRAAAGPGDAHRDPAAEGRSEAACTCRAT